MIEKAALLYSKFKLIVLLVLIVPLFWFGIFPGWKKADSDFPNYYVSSKLLLDGTLAEAYDIQKFNAHISFYNADAKGLFVMYPPTTALVTAFISSLEILTAKRVWLVLSIVAFLGIIKVLSKLINIKLTDAANLSLLCGFNLYNDLMLGQVYTIMVFMILLAFFWFKKNKIILPGILLGIVAAIKFLPLFFLPLFLYKKQYKMSVVMLFTFLMLHTLTICAAGFEPYMAFVNVFKQNYLNGYVANSLATSVQYQSMEVLVNILNQNLMITDEMTTALKLIWKLFWLLLGISACYKYFSKAEFLPVCFASVTLLLLLFENGSATYHLLFSLIALPLIFNQTLNSNWRISLLVAFSLMGFFPFLVHLLNCTGFILSFSRLWCLSLFSALYFISMRVSNLNIE